MSDMAEGDFEVRRAGFSVDRDERGVWVLRDCAGRIEGEFGTQGEALHVALCALGRAYAPGPELRLATHTSDD